MENNLPFVSIIIPVFNNNEGLKKTFFALSQQDYPQEQFEVFVIDNGSLNKPNIPKGTNVKLLEESNYPGSPYSARNRGLEHSKGDVIVFLDATCQPIEQWISAGLEALKDADMVGGDVEFLIDEKSTIAEVYDSLFNIQMKDSVIGRNVAKTCNLFVKREVVNTIGSFPEGLRSGGDVRWTKKANQAGFKIVFSEDAKVLMKPKKIKALVKKQFRVGKGQPLIWKETKSSGVNLVKKVLLCWLPPNPKQLKDRMDKSGHVFIYKHSFSLFFLGWYLRIINGIGNIAGFLVKHCIRNERY